MSNQEDIRENDSQQQKKKRKKPPKVQWTWIDEEVLHLIAAVEEYKCIWDVRTNDYRDLVKRNAAWRLISETVFADKITPDQLKVNQCILICLFSFTIFILFDSASGEMASIELYTPR